MIKKMVITLILFSSAEFFRIVFLSSNIIFLIQFVITAMMFVILVVQEIYGKNGTIKLNFKSPIFLIYTGMFLSMIVAQAYHGQSYALTIWAQRYMYYYVFYFFLHFLKPDIKDLEKIVISLGVIYALSYFVQYAIYPTTLFDVRQDADRGTIRIFLPGSSFLTIALFICLNRFYLNNKLINVFLVLLFFSILVLQGTRNSLAATALVIFYSLIFSKTIRSRYVIYFLVLLSFIPVYILFQDIFAGLIELSEKESSSFESNIRVRAATFFLTDFFPNKLAYFFGNGQDHGRSEYGMRIGAYMLYRGYYQSDIGFIGEFSKFGIVFAIGAIWFLIKALTTKLKPEYAYIKYYIMRLCMLLPFGSSFTNSFSIVALCILIYIIDKNIYILKEEKLEEEKVPDDAIPITQ